MYFLSSGAYQHCSKILPDSTGKIPVELGKEFTATCSLTPDGQYTADDIEWYFLNVTVPRTSYKKINDLAVSLTVNISDTMANPLKCIASTKAGTLLDSCAYGIYLDKGCEYLFSSAHSYYGQMSAVCHFVL